MSIINWLKRFKPEDPLRLVANVRQQNRIANILNDIQGVNCRIIKPLNAEGKGWLIVVDGGSDVEPTDGNRENWPDPFSNSAETNPQLFDVYEQTAYTFKVRGTPMADYAVWVGGQPKAVTAGTGGKKLDEAITASAATYVYIKVTMGTTVTVTLEVDTSFPAGDYDYEIFPLWYLPWAAGAIDWANAMDMRHAIHVPQIM